MLAPLSFPFLWAQLQAPGAANRIRPVLTWLFILGEPNVTVPGFYGALITWFKVISLFCLGGGILFWLMKAIRERTAFRGSVLDIAAVVAIVGTIGTVLLRVLESTERIPIYKLGGVYTVYWLSGLWLLIFFLWIEAAIWSAIRKFGSWVDVVVVVGVHLALGLGIFVGYAAAGAYNEAVANTTQPKIGPIQAFLDGVRLAGTYMGYVVLLRVVWQVLVEIVFVRFRRLYSIARLSLVESSRRMWAPYVVVTVFLVILAFTHWFLQPPRAAELGRLYVGTLSLLCSLLLTVMVTLLTPLSLPQDIQGQTIYTVVSKPVRRIELVWGRLLGFMTIVTVLVVVFGLISLGYLWRTVYGAIQATEAEAVKAAQQNRITDARQLREQADQLRTRMAARVPVFGSLTFLDSRGTKHVRGIDVGQEQSLREPRSHIEGATQATAIWQYGILADPLTPPGVRPIIIDRRIPVASILQPNTVEGLLNQTFELKYQIEAAQRDQADPNVTPARATQLSSTITRAQTELDRATDAYNKLKAQADSAAAKVAEAEKAQRKTEEQTLRRQADAYHTPPIPLEMTFTVYRTTKGRVGEPVYAELEATNPRTRAEYRNIFPIREYYTNKQVLPSSLLAGSGGDLTIKVRCISPTQYLGMAESDLFILSRSGDFGTNFMKGLFGVWLQAMVLTAIGVFAGTFLSWPVALLTTIAFFLAGQVAFAFLLDFTRQSMIGGGPFESLIRLLSHDNQMSDLTPTVAVVTAKTLDALVMPVMSRLVYIVPNFSALDVSNTVADGFAVSWGLLGSNLLLALAYAVPFSIAGFYILKHREVAA